ncbi:MAG TPA: hypothetical protein VGM23_09060, partial [Armatimonadota bacterium]
MRFHLLGLLIILVLSAPAFAAVTLTQENGNYILENDYVRLRINPAKGGMVDRYLVKATNRQLLADDQFLLIDHFWQQRWPGEFMSAPYEAKVVASTPEAATLEVSRVSQGEGKNVTQAGICIRRRMTLRADSAQLYVEVAMENTAPTGRLAGYWLQNQPYANGAKEEKQCYFAPTVRGVSQGSYEVASDRVTVDENGSTDGFTRNPQHGWLAVLGADSHNGMAYVMKYDELLFLYTCFPSFTMEWQYKSAAIPTGKAWKTDFVLYPLVNLPRVDYASRRLVAAVEPADVDGNLVAKVTLAPAAGKLTEVTVSGEAMLPHKTLRPIIPLLPQQIALLGASMSLSFQVPHDITEPVVLRFTIKGKNGEEPFTETFETWYGARYGKNWQVDTNPLYVFPSPERHVSFLKPDAIVKTKNATPRVLICKGLYADDFLPPSAFATLKAEVTSSYFSPTSTFPATLTYFPASYEDLMSYDVIALINIDGVALGDAGLEMLKDFVTHGGTLVYGGDLCAYAQSGVTGTSLAELLPV